MGIDMGFFLEIYVGNILYHSIHMVYSVKLCFFIFLLEDTVESVPNLPLGSDFSARPAIQIATAHVAFCSES
jgi:hypothetical protein